ncbi:MAG: S41 family peptidase [Sterolibacterium sp.]|jgi:carboxyl-terminal processing protease
MDFKYMALRSLAKLVMATLIATSPSVFGAETAGFLTVEQRAEDFNRFCRFVEEEYAYFDLKRTDWDRTCRFYAPQVGSATNRAAFVELLELALGELYDSHAHLGTNTRRSYRLVPTQSDLFATWSNGVAILSAVRRKSGAEDAGLLPGMEVVAINGEPIETVLASIEPKFLSRQDPAAREWALNVALAGRRDLETTRLSTRTGGRLQAFEFVPTTLAPKALLSHRTIANVGYIRMNNSLGEHALVQAFDQAISDMSAVRALVIDLRDTPSGGNTAVARGLMGRLVKCTLPYQRHELVSEYRSTGIRRLWVEYVTPRSTPFLKPVVVLVGPWTGSMGEGMAIGLNATHGAPVLGRPMAHLLGANGEIVLPHSKIVVRIPTEKLFHVDGTPRQAFVPRAIPSSSPASTTRDRELSFAIDFARKMSRLKNPSIERTCPGEPGQASHVKRPVSGIAERRPK